MESGGIRNFGFASFQQKMCSVIVRLEIKSIRSRNGKAEGKTAEKSV